MEPTPPSDGGGAEDEDQSGRDPRYGRFQLGKRFNTNQVPLGFVSGQSSTWEPLGNKRVHVAQPFLGLKKRQCTVQPTISPSGKAIRSAIIFRGRGKWLIILQSRLTTNAWMYTSSLDWVKRTYSKSLTKMDGKVPEAQSALCADYLHGQVRQEFRKYPHKERKTLRWVVPAGCTDEVQAIDVGYGRLLKIYVSQQPNEWLEHGDNLKTWECNGLTTPEQRIQITRWVGASIDSINASAIYRHSLFEKTGKGMTAGGTGDEKITPESLKDAYHYTCGGSRCW